jgi:flavin reductase (NADH)
VTPSPTEASGASPMDFRGLMAGFPTGVAVVAAFDLQGRPRGMTCTSVCSVSLEPPILLVCIRHGSPTLAAIMHRAGFTVNLLHIGAESTARLFASGKADRFKDVRWCVSPDADGPHLPDDSHAIADCQVFRTESVGDHTVVFGTVLRISQQGTGQHQASRPLLYGLRQYAAWPPPRFEKLEQEKVALARDVLDIEAAQKSLPGAGDLVSGRARAEGPQPRRFRAAAAGQVIDVQPDEVPSTTGSSTSRSSHPARQRK